MCGIAGIVTNQQNAVDSDRLLQMKNAMSHRGPDGDGEWFNQHRTVGFAHKRLAIIDLSDRAAQPMSSADGQIHIVFNGEIYNHPELKAWCEAKGAVYRTNSDTETLLQLYALEGEQFVQRLRGMFAFAIWDETSRKLLMARDPLGIKPLYYTQNNDTIYFASEIKALLAGGINADRSAAGVTSFYLWGYVTEPHTWYRSISLLPAGHTLSWKPGTGARIACYCDIVDLLRSYPNIGDSSDLGSLLVDSVNHHFLADVPVGLFLSAGIDSTALLSIAAECVDAEALQAITLGFDEFAGTANDETPIARMMADRIGCSHTVLIGRKEDFWEEVETLFSAMDQPTIDGVNTYLVSSVAANAGLKAAMSGVGGDEMFGGYPSFDQIPRLTSSLGWCNRRFGRAVRSLLAPITARLTSPKYAGIFEYGSDVPGAFLLRRALFMPWELPELVGEKMTRDGLESLDVLGGLEKVTKGIDTAFDQVTALELSIYLRNCLLREADWAGMAHGLEIRTPLVDKELLAGIIGIRSLRRGQPLRKADLANAPRRPLPKEITGRAKTGFRVPVRSWLLSSNDRGKGHAALDRGDRAWAREVASRFVS